MKDKIRALRVVNDLSSRALEHYLESLKKTFGQKVNKLDKKARSEYEIYGMKILEISLQSSSINKHHIKHPEVARIVDEETKMQTC